LEDDQEIGGAEAMTVGGRNICDENIPTICALIADAFLDSRYIIFLFKINVTKNRIINPTLRCILYTIYAVVKQELRILTLAFQSA